MDFILLEIILVSIFIYIIRKKINIFNPTNLTNIYWLFLIFLSVSFKLLFNLYFSFNSLIIISLYLLFFNLGVFLTQSFSKKSFKKIPEKSISFSYQKINFILFFTSLAGIIVLIAQLILLDLIPYSLNDLMLIPNKISTIRYLNDNSMPVWGYFFMAILYSGSYVSGVNFAVNKNKLSLIIGGLPILISVIYSLINGVKLTVVFSFILVVCGLLTFSKRDIILLKIKSNLIAIVLILLSLILIIPVTGSLRRYGEKKSTTNYSIYTISYFSSINAFSKWYDTEYNLDKKNTPFKYSLAGIHNIYNKDRESGIFAKPITVKQNQNEIIITNVYSILRSLIEDFGIIGLVLCSFLIGMIITIFDAYCIKDYILSKVIISAYFSFLFQSFAGSVFTYNTFILTWIISLLLIYYITNNKNEKRLIHYSKL